MAVPQLVLGAFNLTDWLGVTYNTHVIAEGTSKGAPVPLEVAVQSWLQDGSVVVTQGYDNRTVTLRVKFRGPSLTAVAQAEAAFFAELGKPNTLTWTPASGPASVFVVVTSSMEEAPSQDGDLAEMQAFPWRTYNVRLLCEAFTRSAAETVTAALPASGATTTVLDAMGATTGWTGFVDGVSATVTNTTGPPSINSVTTSVGQGRFLLAMQKTFSATTTSTKLLVIDWKSSIPFAGTSLVVTGDGFSLALVAEQASPTLGYVRSYYYVPASSLAVVRIEYTSNGVLPAMARTLSLDNISVTNVPPSSGTARQQMRSLTLAGSAPAPSALKIESSTAALGDGTLIYTFPAGLGNGYTPSQRPYRTAGSTVTSDAAMVSGSREGLSNIGTTFQPPYALCPPGSYIAIARLGLPSGSETGSITVAASSSLAPTMGAVSKTTSVFLSTTYRAFALCRLTLPTVDIPLTTTSSVVVNISATGWSGTPTLDELWLFNTTIGQLIWVDCGTGAGTSGGSARRLFVNPANTTTPRPTLLMGHAADGSDSFYPSSPVGSVKAWQAPRFIPPQATVFFVTPNATDATATLTYAPRWHTNAGS